MEWKWKCKNDGNAKNVFLTLGAWVGSGLGGLLEGMIFCALSVVSHTVF